MHLFFGLKIIRTTKKIICLFIITGIFLGTNPLWATEKTALSETRLAPIKIEFLVSALQKNSNTAFIPGKHGMKIKKENDLLLRFVNRERGYVYLININNKGLYMLYPFDNQTIISAGAHELKKDGVTQKYSLINSQGDQFFIAIFSRIILSQEKDISPLFKDLSWLQKGRIDIALLEKKIPDIAMDYFTIFVP